MFTKCLVEARHSTVSTSVRRKENSFLCPPGLSGWALPIKLTEERLAREKAHTFHLMLTVLGGTGVFTEKKIPKKWSRPKSLYSILTNAVNCGDVTRQRKVNRGRN